MDFTRDKKKQQTTIRDKVENLIQIGERLVEESVKARVQEEIKANVQENLIGDVVEEQHDEF